MSTIIQTCYESQFMDSSSKILKLKVSASSTSSRDELKINNISAKTEYVGTKSFLHYLTHMSSSTPKNSIIEDKENVYVHTLSKSASSRLSETSLQLCTENLGCETGSFLMFDSTNILSLSSRKEDEAQKETISAKKTEGGSYSMKKVRSLAAFPPPLTTMCGEKALQIRSVRENGRLISKAVEIPSQEPCFVADRSDGRLRLRLALLNNFETNDVVDQVQAMSPSEEFQTSPSPSKEVEDEDEDEDEYDLEMTSNDENHQIKSVDDDNNDDDNDDKKCKLVMSKEVVNYDVEGEYKFRRFVRCKEGNKGLSKWEPMWVATS